jgi:hypothetical protein
MRIGIFGDSFATESNGWPEKNVNGKSWSSIIKEHPDFKVSNFAEFGSSVYFSYEKFKENKDQFDKIIFIGTFPGRVFAPNTVGKHYHSGMLDSATRATRRSRHWLDEKEMDALEKYYKYFYNEGEAISMKKLMIADIIKEKNVLYIDVDFLVKVHTIDRFFYKITAPSTPNDYRYNHMNNENNVILFNKINDWIRHGVFSADVADFVNPKPDDFDNYFTRDVL